MPVQAQETIFEAVIVPHRSLPPRGLKALVGAICVLSALVAALLCFLGAWPVLGFTGAEILLAVWLILRHARGARESELVLLSPSALRVVRTDRHGRRAERAFSPDWMNVVLEERPGRVPALWLASRDVREEIAAQLGEAEKRDLAEALRTALHRWRHPVFDNPQLREPASQ